MTKRKIQSITIIGRKWFDKVNGNTYNTAIILVNGEPVGKTEYQYGYGDFYEQAATELLEKNGYIKLEHYENGGNEMLWSYCDKHNIAYYRTDAWYLKREL